MPDSQPQETLLLVDPDLDFLEWATKHLSAKGLRILRCDDAGKAIKVIEKTSVSVVVSAVTLQPFDGMDLLVESVRKAPTPW